MVSEFSLLLQDVVLCGPAQVQKLARRVGKTYSTLVREVNPYDSGAKLGADTLMQIMEVSRDMRPLIYMAEKLGCELRKTDEEASKSAISDGLLGGRSQNVSTSIRAEANRCEHGNEA